jgi:tyrosine-protein phosphatase YwqE
LDLEELKAKAWKIYATEICEEGLRFVDESDAAKLVRRSFKMAEIFMKFEQQQVRAPEPTRNNTSATPQQAQPERQQQSSRREETSGNPEAAASEDQEPQDSAEAPSVGDAK